MIYRDSDDFLLSIRERARKNQVRLGLRLARHNDLDAADQRILLSRLRACLVFGIDGSSDRVVYLRYDGRRLMVKEIFRSNIVCTYLVDDDIGVRDLNLELAVIDGILGALDRATSEALSSYLPQVTKQSLNRKEVIY